MMARPRSFASGSRTAAIGWRSSTSSTRSRSTSGPSSDGSTKCSSASSRGATSCRYRMSPLLRAPAVMVDTWLTRRKLRKAIKAFRPDTIVSVYPLASLVLGRMRRTKLLRVPVVTYLTDFAVHSLWVHPGIDRHLAVSELSAQAAAARGGKDARVHGPLVADRFREARIDRAAVRSALGLEPDDRAVLVVAGSWGVGDVVATVEAIGRTGEFHPITVCGRDEKLRADLESRGFGTVIGWTDEMPTLMTAADALVENAGGLTCMEAFAVGPPGDHVPADRRPRQGQRRDDGALRRQLLRARRGGAARRACARSPLPVPRATQLVENGRRLFVGDPADRRRRARGCQRLRRPQGAGGRAPHTQRATLGHDRGRERRRAVHRAHRRRPGGLGDRRRGGQAARERPSTPLTSVCASTITSSDDRVLLAAINDLGVSVVVDAQTAGHRSPELEWLADRNVDIANGGWGKGTLLPWNQARNDLDRAGKLIAREVGEPTHEFVPAGGSTRSTSSTHGARSRRLVVPDHTFGPESLPSTVEARKVYLLDGRDRDREGDGDRGVRPRGAARRTPVCTRTRSGSSAEAPRHEARCRCGRGGSRCGHGARGTRARRCVADRGAHHAAPRRCRPARSRRADVRRRPRPGVDARGPLACSTTSAGSATFFMLGDMVRRSPTHRSGRRGCRARGRGPR